MHTRWRRAEDRGGAGALADCLRAFWRPLLLIAAGFAPAASEDPAPAGENQDRAVAGTIAELGGVIAAIRRNLEGQEAAWPARRQGPASEAVPPLGVKVLQDHLDELLGQKEAILWRLEKEIAGDSWIDRGSRKPLRSFDALLDALKEAEEPAFIEAIVPIAVRLGKGDERTVQTLIQAARGRTPCPRSIVEGLAEIGNPEASRFLLDLGIQEKSAEVLRAAARSGQAEALEGLIDLVEGEDREAGGAAQEAIARLEPPERGSTRELEDLVASRLVSVRSVELKTALIVYLGLFRRESHLSLLAGIYSTSAEARVRLASIAALGNLGDPAVEFLLGELEEPDLPIAIRRACVNALGAARDLSAVNRLIDLLAEPQLRRDAARALRRITGADLGEGQGVWQRWWKMRLQCGEEGAGEIQDEPPDPDEETPEMEEPPSGG